MYVVPLRFFDRLLIPGCTAHGFDLTLSGLGIPRAITLTDCNPFRVAGQDVLAG